MDQSNRIIMKNLTIIFLFFCLTTSATNKTNNPFESGHYMWITNYYFSNTGSDGAAGTSTGTAWQTMAKFNSMFSGFSPGDNVYFERGGTWNDAAMVISRSGSRSEERRVGEGGRVRWGVGGY